MQMSHEPAKAKTEPTQLSKRISALLAERNRRIAEENALNPRDPGEAEFGEMPEAIMVILSARYLSLGLYHEWGENTIDRIIDEIIMEINCDNYNPWPDLTRSMLSFMLAEREWPDDLFCYAISDDCNEQLNLRDRVKAHFFCDWLKHGIQIQLDRLRALEAKVDSQRQRIVEFRREAKAN